ncbi:MAG TPA: RidA family protein [Stellaceae bacterium]|nr:RidA family protein [Stellaceae bacterium]
MDRTVVEVPVISAGIRKAGVPLSPVIKANGFVFVSGMPPMDPKTGAFAKGDIATQTELSLQAVKQALEAAGSSIAKVCKVTVYVSNAAHFRTINEVYGRTFAEAPPARTFVAVGSWPLDFDIEIECIALA